MTDNFSELLFAANPVPTFAIDAEHVVTHFNRACAEILGVEASSVLGTKNLGRVFYGRDRPVMADLIVDGSMKAIIDDLYQNRYRSSLTIPDAYEAEGFFPNLGASGRWLFFTAAPMLNAAGDIVGAEGALVELATATSSRWLFLGPDAAGLKVRLDGQDVLVISPPC